METKRRGRPKKEVAKSSKIGVMTLDLKPERLRCVECQDGELARVRLRALIVLADHVRQNKAKRTVGCCTPWFPQIRQ